MHPTALAKRTHVGSVFCLLTSSIYLRGFLLPLHMDLEEAMGWLNGHKNKTPTYVVYKRPTSKQGTHTD